MEEKEKKALAETPNDNLEPESTPPQNDQLAELEHLRQRLDAKDLEAKQNYERFLRQAAELENFKKRSAREREEALRYANENLIKDLLPVLDNLERAMDYAKGGGDGKPLAEGVEMVLKSLLEVLSKHGVTPISALGETFNPQKHQAFEQVETQEHEPNTVIGEHHKGYYLFDRLLRPALVSVARQPEKKAEKAAGGEVEKGKDDD